MPGIGHLTIRSGTQKPVNFLLGSAMKMACQETTLMYGWMKAELSKLEGDCFKYL
jgi:hypothetical protein